MTKIELNRIFNTSFHGSQLWDLFGYEFERMDKTWNTSQRIMLKIPRNSHRYFLEPLSGIQHIKFSLMKRFVKFIKKISNSQKHVLRNILGIVKKDCRSTTGRNLRKIMLLLGNTSIDEINEEDLNKQTYSPVNNHDEWRIVMAKELVEIKNKNVIVHSFTSTELDEILEEVMT